MSQRSIQINPLNKPASWEVIRDRRNEIELLPITLSDGRTFDYDKDAMDRFERAIEQFDFLPTLTNNTLGWKLFDNSIQFFTKAELTAVRDELKQKQAIRAALIFVRAEELAALNVTVGQVQDLTTWGV